MSLCMETSDHKTARFNLHIAFFDKIFNGLMGIFDRISSTALVSLIMCADTVTKFNKL